MIYKLPKPLVVDQPVLTNSVSLSIRALYEMSHQLKSLGLWQVSGDYDFLCSWLISKTWEHPYKKGIHLDPDPAGLSTKDAYAHDCPIPFVKDYSFCSLCTDKNQAISILADSSSLLTSMLSEYTDEEERVAIPEYISYTGELIALLGGTPPVPPEPPVGSSYVYVFGHSNIIASEYDEEEQTVTYSGTTESLEDFYFRHDKLLARNASLEANLEVVFEGVTYNLGFIDSDFKYYYKDAGILNNADGTIESIYLPHGTFDKLDLNYLDKVFIFKEGVYGELDNPPEDPTTLKGGYVYLASFNQQQEASYNDLLEIVVF